MEHKYVIISLGISANQILPSKGTTLHIAENMCMTFEVIL